MTEAKRRAPVSVQAKRGTETGARNTSQSQQLRGVSGNQIQRKSAAKTVLSARKKWLAHHLAEPSRKGRLAA
jgi:hypothetical protein